MITANYDSNTISVIDVSTDAFDNDASTFGTIHNVVVGNGPTSVTILQDGSRAYVANSKDSTISVVNLSSYTVEKVIALPLNPDLSTPHPRMVASTYNYPTGKVYVTSQDSSNLVILRTDTDTIDATLQLQGNLINTRVSRQNAGLTTQIDNNSYSPGERGTLVRQGPCRHSCRPIRLLVSWRESRRSKFIAMMRGCNQ